MGGSRARTGVVVVLLTVASHRPELHASRELASIPFRGDGTMQLTRGPAGQTASTKTDGAEKRGQSRKVSKPLPPPLALAVTLLGWFGDDIPQFELAVERPPDATPTAEAWVRYNGDGSAVPIVYVATDSNVYRNAPKDYQSLVKLAGILAHERWHLRHGPDEVAAYDTQLSTMTYLHASSANLAEVRRSLNWVQQRAKNRAR